MPPEGFRCSGLLAESLEEFVKKALPLQCGGLRGPGAKGGPRGGGDSQGDW